MNTLEVVMPAYAADAGAQRGGAPFLAVVAQPSAFSLAQRVIHNRDHAKKPWESSCVEVSNADLRFYFETGTPEGLSGYRYVARAVALGELPGKTTNMMGAGFATWSVPRDEYQAMLRAQHGLTDE